MISSLFLVSLGMTGESKYHRGVGVFGFHLDGGGHHGHGVETHKYKHTHIYKPNHAQTHTHTHTHTHLPTHTHIHSGGALISGELTLHIMDITSLSDKLKVM